MKKYFIISFFALILIPIAFGQTLIKLTKLNGVYTLPCQVNGKSFSFIFDTGASDVSLSSDFYNQAIKNGILKVSDMLPGIINYQLADGSIHPSNLINIRELKIGNLKLNNIIGSIKESTNAPLLLGQSVLEKFGAYTIDYTTLTLTIKGNYKSDLDLALKVAKQKRLDQLKNSGRDDRITLLQRQIQQTKVDILSDTKIASGLEFEVSKIEFKEYDGELTFKYDITNNSGIDYKLKALSQLYIFIDVFTDEGKVYSTSVPTEQMLAGNTVNGHDLRVKLRNKIPKYFRIYGVVNGPYLSTIEN